MNKRNNLKEVFTQPTYIEMNEETDFEGILSQAISEGLTCINTIVAPVLRAYLDDAVTTEIGHMKSKSTVKDVKSLEKGLERIFGFGAKVFEKKILEALYENLSIDSQAGENKSFSEAVKEAKRIYESQILRNQASKARKNNSRVRSRGAKKR